MREKDLSARMQLKLGSRLKAVCDAAKAPFLVSDRADLSRTLRAGGVHLPSDGLPPRAVARFYLGRLIGVSTHSLPEIEAAKEAGADYLFHGPVFDTPSKRAYGLPVGLDLIRAYKSALQDSQRVQVRSSSPKTKVYGLGGITFENAPSVIAAGADGVAVIRAVYAAKDPAKSVASLFEVAGPHLRSLSSKFGKRF